ncbi:hypothetical protein DAI22_05g231600 [Oryza sativa Japonica Group]|nr:hypothetical protein DAI22_05g231600 [Oryza sativa Japonica Group]
MGALLDELAPPSAHACTAGRRSARSRGPPVGREEVDGASRERGRCGGWRQATREQAAAPGGEETGGAEVAGVEPWSRASVADDGGGAAMAGIVPTGGATSRAAAAACAGSDSCVSSSSWRRRRRRHQGS